MKVVPGRAPLSPTKVTTPEIPYSQLLPGDEEEEILNWAETLNPSPTTPNKVQQLKKEVLEHSKEMKISFLLMTKANHHWAAPDPVVLAEWNTAHMDFTKTLIPTLIRHYDKLVRIETEKQDNKHKQMLENIHNSARETLNT